MKLIIAYLESEQIAHVRKVLSERTINKISTIKMVEDHQQQRFRRVFRRVNAAESPSTKVSIEVAVHDEKVQLAVDAVVEGARTGGSGDGTILVMPIDDCIRVRTGERGADALR